MRFGAQLLISSTGLLVVSCALVPLVSRYGLPGAAYALCAAAFVEGCAYIALTAYDFRHDARLRIGEDAALAAACDR
jgi:O-antigen/teichoic acid export membrane protein